MKRFFIHVFHFNFCGGDMFTTKFKKYALSTNLAVFSLLAISLIALAGGKYMLTYKGKKGQVLHYKTVASIEQSQEQMGREVSSNINAETYMTSEVENVADNGRLSFIYKLDSARTKIKNMMMDSTIVNPPGIIGKRMRLVIEANGKRVKSEEIDTMKVGGPMGRSGLRQMLSFRQPELPAKEVGVGDSWTTARPDTNDAMGGKMISTANVTYRVTSEVDTLGYKCLRLSYSGDVTVKGKGKQRGMNFFIEGDGPTEGTAYFAPKEGIYVAGTSVSDIDMTIAITGQMEMTMPMSSNVQTTTVLLK